jgi:hypothetical protein
MNEKNEKPVMTEEEDELYEKIMEVLVQIRTMESNRKV